jgi:multisubunit Na+/H+ antiporter MnhG subunit
VSARDWFAGALLAGGVAVQLLSCVGLLVAASPLDRLHLVAPATVLGGPLVCAAVLVNESFSLGGVHAIVIGATLLATGPVITHVIARAVRLRETGGQLVLPSELPDEG